MIDDDEIELERREALIRERAYGPVRRRRSRIWGRDRAIERDREDAARERETFAIAGFRLGGGGAALVVIGLLLMAIAYFGIGLEGFGGYAADYATGYSPAVDPYASSYGTYGGSELLSQRPMMFMGGGFLFLAGWILVVASRLRALLLAETL